MRLQTKALYNLLRFNTEGQHDRDVEQWQILDYRILSDASIFQKLLDLHIAITKDVFVELAETEDSPEELTDSIVDAIKNFEAHDQIYLLIFELWRRYVPQKLTLSVFCDELDERIYLYDEGALESDENIQDALANLEEILDENADEGVKPREAFESLSDYVAHDLEGFLCDYISEQIDAGYEFYATELIEGFYPYMKDSYWFDFLKIRISSSDPTSNANQELLRMIQKLKKTPDIDLQLEMLRFLSCSLDRSLFLKLVKNTLNIVETEEDFREVLEYIADFYRRLDLEEEEKTISHVIQRRMQQNQELEKEDPDLKKISKFVCH